MKTFAAAFAFLIVAIAMVIVDSASTSTTPETTTEAPTPAPTQAAAAKQPGPGGNYPWVGPFGGVFPVSGEQEMEGSPCKNHAQCRVFEMDLWCVKSPYFKGKRCMDVDNYAMMGGF